MTVKQVFKAEDGSEHNSAEDAERRNALLLASAELQAAIDKVRRALGETAKTADGHYLDMTKSCYVYRVTSPNAYHPPRIQRFFFFPYTAAVMYSDHDPPKLTITISEGQEAGLTLNVENLYLSEKEARKALVVAAEKWFEMVKEEKRLLDKTFGSVHD